MSRFSVQEKRTFELALRDRVLKSKRNEMLYNDVIEFQQPNYHPQNVCYFYTLKTAVTSNFFLYILCLFPFRSLKC